MSKLRNVKANSCKPAGKTNSSAGCEKSRFPDAEPLGVPPPSCSWVLSKLNIGNCMAPWSRCSFKMQLVESGSKESGEFPSVDRAVEEPQTGNSTEHASQETHKGRSWCWLQNVLRTLGHWGISPTLHHLLSISSLLLPSGKRSCSHLLIYPMNTLPQNTPASMWGAQDRTTKK